MKYRVKYYGVDKDEFIIKSKVVKENLLNEEEFSKLKVRYLFKQYGLTWYVNREIYNIDDDIIEVEVVQTNTQ